jgi:hypothetical protein
MSKELISEKMNILREIKRLKKTSYTPEDDFKKEKRLKNKLKKINKKLKND